MGFKPASKASAVLTGLLAVSGSIVLGACSSGSEDSKRPDVILITVDTLRADYLGVTGRATAKTPYIDRLVRGGTYFENAFTPMPRTTPGVGSLLTGLWPQHHGCREVGEPVVAGTTLAEVLATQGYHTVAVSANTSAGPLQELDRGFVQFVDGEAIKQKYEGRLYRDGTAVPPSGIGWAEAVTREAIELVRQTPKDTPLLLWVLYFDPHTLYRPPSPWQEQVDAPRCWELYRRYTEESPHLAWQPLTDFDGVASWGMADCQKLYDAEITYTDHQIGRLMDGLRQNERLQHTFVVFAADHGENFGEGGLFFEHGDNAHDAGIRVPLAISGPGISENRLHRGSVSLVDVVPTLLRLLETPERNLPEMDGRDLTPRLMQAGAPVDEGDGHVVFAESASALQNQSYATILTGRASERACINGPQYTLCDLSKNKLGEPALFDHVADPGLTRNIAADHPDEVRDLQKARALWPPQSARFRVATTSRFKLVHSPRIEGGYSRALYDRVADPEEQHDVSSRHPEVAKNLERLLEAWAADIPTEAPQPVNSKVTEALRNLGYIDDPR